jgi:hypothetical protein
MQIESIVFNLLQVPFYSKNSSKYKAVPKWWYNFPIERKGRTFLAEPE